MRPILALALAAVVLCAGAAPAREHRGNRVTRRSAARVDATDELVRRHAARLSSAAPLPFLNVLDFGAKGDNATDNTGPFNDALNAAASAGGGVVVAPAGLYVFQGVVNIPSAVTLKGSYEVVPSHQMVPNNPPPTDGTVLLPYSGRGNESAAPFITVNEDAALVGVVVFYPQQERSGTPIPFPYTISMTGNNAAVTDVELLNSFNGIYAVEAHRHYIARVQGQVGRAGRPCVHSCP